MKRIDQFYRALETVSTVAELAPLLRDIEAMASGLDLLTELLATLKVGDATVHTRIIDGIAAVYAKLNQCKAQAGHKQKSFGSVEAAAQFGAQFKLLSQSITNALGLATTPEACDEQMARLLVQLEELESQFADREEFLADIVVKREEIYEAFEAHKQQLLDERQRKAQAVVDAASRVLASIERRAQKFTDAQQLNTFLQPMPWCKKCANLSPSCAPWIMPSKRMTWRQNSKVSAIRAHAPCGIKAICLRRAAMS
ncbi:MAG: hypothetical protein NVV73_05230 [Cellvibrionaceae bacterium]|nr:hypothetical protein [Cellvibrionaceae bacterium]